MQPDGILASLGTPSPDEIEAIDGSPCFLPLTGRLFYDDLRIPAIFRSSTLKSKVEELEGRSCNALFGSSARGAITAWLDVGCGLAPRRIVQVKRSGDKVDASKTLEAASRDWGGPFEVVTTRYQAINLELVNGHYVPTHYVVQVTTESSKWGTEVQTWTCKLTQCELAPTFAKDAFTVSTPIPNGYPVTVRGQEQIEYEWRNGRIVKKVNASSVANAMGNWFQGGSLLGRGALILAVLAVAGFVLNLWLRRRRASREGAA